MDRRRLRMLTRTRTGTGDTGLIDFIIKRAEQYDMGRFLHNDHKITCVYADPERFQHTCLAHGVLPESILALMCLNS